MTWWIWILLGLLLLMVELTAFGDFYIIFFGLGALIIGLLVALEIGGPLWVQWLLFSIISLAAMLLLRRHLIRMIQPKGRDSAEDNLVRKTAVVIEEIGAGRMGKVETR
ncbi:MAG: NfeD family protein, partial [Candidatus Binatia bacterium]|nr:NfeD family protein [Candidatus Binatia bacterium]